MLILLCGYKRCGKDTVASYLSNKYDFHHLKISYLLKKTLKLLFNFSEDKGVKGEPQKVEIYTFVKLFFEID